MKVRNVTALRVSADDLEFICLLDGVAGISARGRERQHLCTGTLRLEQERREVGRIERRADLSDNLAALVRDSFGRLALHGLPEGIIRRDEEPGIAACLITPFGGAAARA